MMRWVRGIAAAAVALAAVMGTLVVTTASAAAQGPEMCITRFRVEDTEDVLPDGDEPLLKVKTVFWSAPGSIDEPGSAAVNKTVHVGDVVQAWDDDTDDTGKPVVLPGDDFIGSGEVGRSGGTLVFENDDARYRADYRPGGCVGN